MPLSLAEPQPAPADQAAPLRVSQSSADRALYAAITLLVLLAALLHRALVGSPVFPMDDAYITLHNAQVLHWGHDPNYFGTPALAGATSAVHLALVALLMFALSPPVALWAALWLAALAYTLGLVIPPLGALAHPASSRAGTAASRVRRVNLGGACGGRR